MFNFDAEHLYEKPNVDYVHNFQGSYSAIIHIINYYSLMQ